MRKLKWLIASTIFLSLTFFTSVYAWLQISNINMIDNIYLGVRLGDELEISVDGINFYKTIDKNLVDELIKDLSFKDVTTTNNEKFTLGPALYFKEAKKNIDYLSLDLWFRVTPEENIEEDRVFKEVYLVNNLDVTYDDAMNNKTVGTYITSKGRTWKSDYSFNNGNEIIKTGDINKYFAKDAMRIGVKSNSNQFIFDTSEDEYRGYGKPYGAFDYYNSKNEFKTTLPKDIPNTLYDLSSEYGHTGIMNNNNSLIVSLERTDNYYIGMATINIWLEGWDADAFDAIKKDSLLIQLEFQVARHLKEGDKDEV